MKDFFNRNRVFIFVILGTCLLLFGGIFLMTKGNSGSSSTINQSILIPQGDYETSGFSNGSYLPATASAKVTLVEFGDYECPACGVYAPFVKQLLTDFAGKINYVFRNYPLSQHTNAPISSAAAEAAGLQGKFWEMHDKIYSTQNDWANLSDPTSVFVGYAKDLGLSTDKFTSDLSSSTVKDKIQNDTNDGNTVGLTETPTFYLDGQKITIDGTYNQLKNLVQGELNK